MSKEHQFVWIQKTDDHSFGWEWVCSDLQVNTVKITDPFHTLLVDKLLTIS